jgi:hypothetical protein
MKNQNIVLSPGGMEALQARFALRVAAHLSEGSRELPHDITERLKSAREQALEAARQARRLETAGAADTLANGGGTVVLGKRGGHADRWLKLASLAPIVALVVGFVAIERVHTKSQIKAAAEVDAALLADDVPPAAYSDPGFVEFLKAPHD